MSATAYEAKFRALSRYATHLCFSPQEQIRRFKKGLRSDLQIPALQVSTADKSLQEVVDFVIEVEGVKPDDFTMASATKKFRKGGEFNGSYSRGQSSGGLSSPTYSVFTTGCSWGSTADRSTFLRVWRLSPDSVVLTETYA